MDTIVLKFGGSSLADNIKLNIVADKIKEFYNSGNKIVVVVSAQGKTTDGLIKEAMSLSSTPDDREMDVLLSTGEQISMAKLAILLNRLEMPAISLTRLASWNIYKQHKPRCNNRKHRPNKNRKRIK